MKSLQHSVLSEDDAPPPRRESTSRDLAGAGSKHACDEASIVGSLFRSQVKKVRSFLSFRLRSVDDANDAAQDVFLKLWRREKAGELREEATAYMISAANSVATDLERHRQRHPQETAEELDPDNIPGPEVGLEDQRHWRDALVHLVSLLKALPEVQRKAFVLHHFKGLGYAQIAAKLRLSQRTVERHMMQAHTQLEAGMKEFL